ncbi:replication initiation and membrane attachment family protein [Ornithinibacillus xuwenensis]|uniref:DnaD domain protein n=1 Tax=Ornithinibacillus xuwenensis TaxID=3144668 RepID=A0ABU9XFG5_9BACI
MNYIGKILPVDGYSVALNGNLPVDYTKALTHLYQPLLGIKAIMLYQTLLHEIEFQREESTIQTHHTLMNYLNIPLDEIYEARLKLEGIGLLKTFEHETSEKTIYHYALQCPFSPHAFFQDAMLTQLLSHHIGKAKFNMIRSAYVDRMANAHPIGQNVTASFSDVFDTIIPEMGVQSLDQTTENTGPELEAIDFLWLEQMLKSRMIPYKRVLTAENKRVMTQMLQLYGLAQYELEKCVLWALTDENYLDVEEFKEACHDAFKTSKKQATIQLVPKTPTKAAPVDNSAPQTKEEQLIRELENISPKQLLEDLSSGNHASEQDLKVIREIMTTQGLPSPVMNVLIHYVLLQSNMKLSKAYLEKIASHWSRANLKTAREAMMFAKQEKERYRSSTEKQTTSKYYKKRTSTEVIPDWFKDRKQTPTAKQSESSVDLEKEKAEIENLLKQYASSNKK